MSAAATAEANAGAGGDTSSMGPKLYIEPQHPILLQLVKDAFASPEDATPQDLRIGDFEGMTYRVIRTSEDPGLLVICAAAPFYRQVLEHGLMEDLESDFPGMLMDPVEGCDVTIGIPLVDPPVPEDEIAERVSRLRTTFLGCPIRRALVKLREGEQGRPLEVAYRPNETMYVVPGPDRVTVVFSVEVGETMDHAIVKVVCQHVASMLQEMTDVSRKVTGSPAISFADATGEPPRELQGKDLHPSEHLVGYLSVTLFADHVKTDAKFHRSLTQLSQFRAFLMYHIKAAKAELHSRMRFRVEEFLKVLRRAQTNDPGEMKRTKTYSGKTFKRNG